MQILRALLLVYGILFGVGALFGREVGYPLAFGVCLGVAALVTVTFLGIHLLDPVRRRCGTVPVISSAF